MEVTAQQVCDAWAAGKVVKAGDVLYKVVDNLWLASAGDGWRVADSAEFRYLLTKLVSGSKGFFRIEAPQARVLTDKEIKQREFYDLVQKMDDDTTRMESSLQCEALPPPPKIPIDGVEAQALSVRIERIQKQLDELVCDVRSLQDARLGQ